RPLPGAGLRAGRGERVLVRIPDRIAWPGAPTGALVDLAGKLRPLTPFESYAAARGAHAALAVLAADWRGARRGGLTGFVDAARTRAERGITAALPAPEARLMRGMVLGQTGAPDPAQRSDFRRAGLSYLLVANGLDVALLIALAWWFLAL